MGLRWRIVAGVLKIDARREAYGRTKRTTTFCTARARPITDRAPTAHYGGGRVFEVAFLKGSLWGVLSLTAHFVEFIVSILTAGITTPHA